MAYQQKNLWSINDMKEFYDSNKTDINKYFSGLIWGKINQPENYSNLRGPDGKPIIPSLHYLASYNYSIFFNVIEENKTNDVVKRVLNWYPLVPTILAGYARIESTFDNRANLMTDRTTYKGLFQIGKKYASAYPDLSGTAPNFDAVPTSTLIGNEPANSVYNTYSSAERVIVHLNKCINSLNKIANENNLKPSDAKYPVAGWATWIFWNQGMRSSNIISNYITNPSGTVKLLGSNNISNKQIPTYADWVDAIRLKMNLVQYVACNRCLERVYKAELEKTYNVKIPGSTIEKNNLDCTPLTSNEYGTPIGNFVKRNVASK